MTKRRRLLNLATLIPGVLLALVASLAGARLVDDLIDHRWETAAACFLLILVAFALSCGLRLLRRQLGLNSNHRASLLDAEARERLGSAAYGREEPGTVMAKVRIRRTATGAAMLRKVRVEIDGITAADLRLGKEVVLDVPVGPHRARARIDWHSSHSLEFTAAENRTTTIELEYPFSSITQVFSSRPGAVDLELVATV